MEDILIREPKMNELEQLNYLSNQIHKIHVNWRPDLYEDVTDIFSIEDLKEIIEKEEILVAYKDGRIIGYAIFNINIKNRRGFYNRKVFMIESICIDEGIRGKGVGKTLIQYLIQYAKEKGCTDFELTVSPENEYAIKLYKNLGMRIKNIKYQMKI